MGSPHPRVGPAVSGGWGLWGPAVDTTCAHCLDALGGNDCRGTNEWPSGLWQSAVAVQSPVRVPPRPLARGLSGCRKWSPTVHLGVSDGWRDSGDRLDGGCQSPWQLPWGSNDLTSESQFYTTSHTRAAAGRPLAPSESQADTCKVKRSRLDAGRSP